jgi:DNA anti-recombination protein RmuC
VLAERLARVGDAGAQRLERRLGEAETALARRRDELLDGLERRLADAETELRRRVDALESLTETERSLIEARLHELGRRIDEAVAAAESRLRGPVATP